ncbi:MAG: DUF47 family protein [Candidatus Acetothermia bacterium]|jgi:predicted phosphate transport protein (TIGR00153 family)|nr:DUF47 family protein [Candidatus Acetothermia bacterium]MDH7504555.1 DUF47 family protein [Candidatus Acetothermia bacterium]
MNRIFRHLVYQYPALDPLVKHAEKVCETVNELAQEVQDYLDQKPVGERSVRISRLEHEADILKSEVRATLPRSDSFLPVNRTDLLEFIWQEDEIADVAQDAAALLPLMELKLPPELAAKWREFPQLMHEGIEIYRRMALGLRELLERGFRREAVNRVLDLLGEVNLLEHHVDLLEAELIKLIYKQQELDAFAKYHLIQVLLKLGDIFDHMENAGGRIRIMSARS